MLTHDGRAFLKKFLQDPGRIGALAPATNQLSRKMAGATWRAYAEANHHAKGLAQALPIIEFGPGTGALTRRIVDMGPVLVERDPGWAALLRQRFPALEVRTECASRTLMALAEPVGIVTSIPLLNNPQSAELKRLISERYAEGLIRFCVLYSYGWLDPLRGAGFRRAQRRAFAPCNLPPAWVWTYA